MSLRSTEARPSLPRRAWRFAMEHKAYWLVPLLVALALLAALLLWPAPDARPPFQY